MSRDGELNFVRHVSQHEIPALKPEKGFVERFLGWQEALELDTYRTVLAELVGTFILVIIGLAAAVATETWKQSGAIQVSVAFDGGLVAAIWAVGHTSGAHLNPAVSIAFVATGKTSVVRAALFIVSQMMGALLAAALLRVATPDAYFSMETASFGCTRLGSSANHLFDVAVHQGIIVEVYWIGPILGAVAGAVLYKWVFAKSWTLGQQSDAAEPDKWPGSYELTPLPAESRPSAVATGRRSQNYEADPANI